MRQAVQSSHLVCKLQTQALRQRRREEAAVERAGQALKQDERLANLRAVGLDEQGARRANACARDALEQGKLAGDTRVRGTPLPVLAKNEIRRQVHTAGLDDEARRLATPAGYQPGLGDLELRAAQRVSAQIALDGAAIDAALQSRRWLQSAAGTPGLRL